LGTLPDLRRQRVGLLQRQPQALCEATHSGGPLLVQRA